MQPTIPTYQGPNAPQNTNPGTKPYKDLQQDVLNLLNWAQATTLRLNNQFTTTQTALNDQILVGPSIASAGTIVVSATIHHVTGTTTIQTITPASGIVGEVYLIADGIFTIGSAGNVALSTGPLRVGEMVCLVYDYNTALWYPSIPSSLYGVTSTGTWTPAIAGDGTAGSSTYNFQVGDYIQTLSPGGQGWVTATFYVGWATFSGAVGDFIITGLPVASINSANHYYGATVYNFSGLTLANGYTVVGVQVPPGSSTLNVIECGSGQTNALTAVAGAGGSGQMLATVTYRIS